MKILITGGAGFIGCNAAARHVKRGNDVIVLDNLSRRGADPFFGRKLASSLSASGLEAVDVGVLSSLWGGEEEGEGRETYLDDLRLQLAGDVPDIERLINDERRAQDTGVRLVFLPIFWAIAKKE